MTSIESILIKNFKNYRFAEFRFGAYNVIKGPNGAGKTNLIEAIYLSLNAHPFLRKLKNLPNDPQKLTIVSSRVRKNGNINITYVELKGAKKTAKINAKQSTIKQFKELFPCVIFSFKTFVEFDSKRYLFSLLDHNTFIHDKTIVDSLTSYHRVLKQKKAILMSENPDPHLLNIKNRELIKLMETISNKRKQSSDEINRTLEQISQKLIGKTARIEYEKAPMDNNLLKKEMERKKILVTLNRDKVSTTINGRNISEFASLGEKKAILFSIINAIIENHGVSKPIVLIDDLEGDLDTVLKGKLLGIIEKLNTQVFLTSLEYEPSSGSIIRLEGEH